MLQCLSQIIDSILFIQNKRNETSQHKCQTETQIHTKGQYIVFRASAPSVGRRRTTESKAVSDFI